jgi:hypothetical protein
MRLASPMGRRTLSAGAACIMVACSLGPAAADSPAFASHGSTTSSRPTLPAAGRRRALPSQLLFVQTGAESIDIYDLQNPGNGPLGTITAGLVGAQYQMTTDAAGDLFVVNNNFLNENQEYITEYSPPYTGSPKILNGVTFPSGVAVDSAGTVYVTNCGGYCSQQPEIYVYQNGSTTPTGTITNSGLDSLGGLSIDKGGNLYASSYNHTDYSGQVFKIPAGSGTPQPLNLKGLIRPFSVAVDAKGSIYVTNAFTSEYILEFKAGKTKASRIIDPFSFLDVPFNAVVGPDHNLYVAIDCGNQSCEAAALGFTPKSNTPFVEVGSPNPGINGVATWPLEK